VWDIIFGSALFEETADVPTGIDDASFPVENGPGVMAAGKLWIAQLVHPFRRRASK
jgi:hypothetical protein